MSETPSQWTTDFRGDHSAEFRHERQGLSVKIEPRYRASASRKRARSGDPQSYRVKIVQDWFSKGIHGDRSMAAKAETWEEAETVATEFMNEFTREHTNQAPDEIEATHRSVEASEFAEQTLVSEAAVEALADATGYSDELLLDVLSTQTNGNHLIVAHRHGSDIVYAHGTPDDLPPNHSLTRIHGAFPIDKTGLEALQMGPDRLVQTVQLSQYVIYRFVAGDMEETDVVLPLGTQVASPEFEISLWNVLEEKW